jgi:lipopolysaccharide export system permease protein
MAFASPFRSPLTRLDRYIFRQTLLALVAVTVALVALIWLTQSLRFVELIVNRGLSPFVFLRLTALLVPWSSSSISAWPATAS